MSFLEVNKLAIGEKKFESLCVKISQWSEFIKIQFDNFWKHFSGNDFENLKIKKVLHQDYTSQFL